MTHSLTLGSLLLTGDLPDADHGYTLSVLAEGMALGRHEGVQEVVRSLLSDGDLVRITRHGNREVAFRVMIEGPSLGALSQGEASLRREIGRANELTWQAPDIFAVPTVFEVITSEMSQTFDDLAELRRRRVFEVTLTCAPFARSINLTTVEALASGTTTVVVDTCDSATGWTGTRNGAASPGDGPSVIWEAGSVGIMELSNTVGFPPETWTLTRTGAIDFSDTPYLEVEITTLSAKGGASLSVSAHVDNGPALPMLEARRLTAASEYFRVTFDTGGVAASSITFMHTSSTGYGHAWQGLQVRHVARTDIAPNITARQLSRILEVGGTERTPASIHIQPPTGSDPLGLTIVHTSPEMGAGYSPPLRRWRVSGNTEFPIPGLGFSGKYEAIHPNAFVAEVPISAIPEGGYEVIVALQTDVVGTHVLHWVVKTVLPDGSIVEQPSVGVPCTFPTATAWHLFSLGVVTLPSVRTSGAGKVQIGILRDPTAGGTVIIDDAWVFRVGEGSALTMVDANQPHVWIDSPTIESPSPRVSMGGSSNRTDSYHPHGRLSASGTHTFTPGRVAMFVATRGVDNAHASLSYYKRWPNNAAEES